MIYSNTHRNLAATIAFWFAFAPTLPLFAQNEVTGVPAQKKKGADTSESTPSVTLGQENGKGVSKQTHKKKKVGIDKKSLKSETKVVEDKISYPQLVIGPGDILYITVYGENGGSASSVLNGGGQLTTDYQVNSDGTIEYPFLGEVHVIGLTPVQTSEKIARLLRKPRKVSVLVKESNTYWVSILGNVGKPGKYQIKGAPTLLSALAEAGGPLPGSDLGGTLLIHDNMRAKINLSEVLQGEGVMKRQPYLYPGDTVMVQKSGWPDLGEMAIVASILASATVLAVELNNLHHP